MTDFLSQAYARLIRIQKSLTRRGFKASVEVIGNQVKLISEYNAEVISFVATNLETGTQYLGYRLPSRGLPGLQKNQVEKILYESCTSTERSLPKKVRDRLLEYHQAWRDSLSQLQYLDQLLDKVKMRRCEVTIGTIGFTPSKIQFIMDRAKERGLEATLDPRGILVREV